MVTTLDGKNLDELNRINMQILNEVKKFLQ